MALFRPRAGRLCSALGSLSALICATVAAPATAHAATPTVLYASPSGSGSTCSLSAPCSLDGAKSAVES